MSKRFVFFAINFSLKTFVVLLSVFLSYYGYAANIVLVDLPMALRNFLFEGAIYKSSIWLAIVLSLIWLVKRPITINNGRDGLTGVAVYLLGRIIWLVKRFPRLTPFDLLIVLPPVFLWGLYFFRHSF